LQFESCKRLAELDEKAYPLVEHKHYDVDLDEAYALDSDYYSSRRKKAKNQQKEVFDRAVVQAKIKIIIFFTNDSKFSELNLLDSNEQMDKNYRFHLE
jgi:hypothetical protein